ncbi:MAG: RsbRD N-terminal domain-containing protein [Actinobacteria bacterium]|nr:RsbRD N-terminal domain-containing protein [Actinomycetota bacterium]
MLSDLLQKSRATVLKRWLQLILESYPPDAAAFLLGQRDQFLNPVGYTISTEIEVLYEELLGDMDSERLSKSLDEIVKIRAVQEFSPSQAVDFVFLLKRAIYQELGDTAASPQLHYDLLELEARIDRMALLAFDLYMQRRERIFEIRTRELRDRSGHLVNRLNRIYGGVDQDQEGLGFDASDIERGGAK